MLSRPDSVLFAASWIDACALWRLFMPHLTMSGSAFYCFASQPDYNTIAAHDICVVQRCCTKPQLDFLEVVAKLGIRIVYDLDDNVWDLPDYNPASATLNAHREGFKACIRMVDVVTVSTWTLKKAVQRHVKFLTHARTGRRIPIVVAENRIYEDMFTAPLPPEECLIGWGGSSSHIGDLSLCEDALVGVASHPSVKIEFRGCMPPESSKLRHLCNFRMKLWSQVAEYPARMPRWRWAIALAPVTEHDFNNSKSPIKMVEAGYCGIPCLASWMKPYDEFCSHDKELRWLLCATQSAWSNKLRDLVHDVARREALGVRMRAVTEEHYSWRKPHEGWLEAFAEARR